MRLSALVLLFLSSFPLQGQFSLVWDNSPAGTTGFEARDAKLLRTHNGARMAVVGESRRGGQSFAVLYVLECKQGSIVDSLVRPGGGFNAVVESPNGDLYLGGFQEKGKKRHCWLASYRPETGELRWEKHLEDAQMVLRMEWLDRQGLAFVQVQKGKGSLGVLRLDWSGGHHRLQKDSVGNGAVGDLKAVLAPGYDAKEVWLVGNGTPSQKEKAGEVWVLKVDEQGVSRNTPFVFGNSKVYEEVSTAALDNEGSMVIVGASQYYSGNENPWLLMSSTEQMDRRQNAVNFSWETNDDDRVSAVVSTTCHGPICLVQKNEGIKSLNTLHRILANAIEAKPFYTLTGYEWFEPAAFLGDALNEGFFYLVGSTSDAKGIGMQLRILNWKETCAKGKKGSGAPLGSVKMRSKGEGSKKIDNGMQSEESATQSTVQGPNIQVLNMELQSNSTGGKASAKANEELLVRFTLINQGADMEAPGNVTIVRQQLRAGVSIHPGDLMRSFPKLGGGRKTCVINIRIRCSENIETGISYFVMALKADGQTFEFESPRIETIKAQDNATSVVWVREGDNRTEKPNNICIFKIYTPQLTVHTFDLEVMGTGGRRQNKANPQRVRSTMIREGLYEHVFEVEIPLDEGRNELFVQLSATLGGGRSDLLVIERGSIRPNLYLIAIGVPYANLKYTTQDARDFFEQLKGMAGGPLFREVKMAQLLNSPETTTRDAIETAFDQLEQIQSGIRTEDYVMVFISSHGDVYRGASQERFFILPSDYESKLNMPSSTLHLNDKTPTEAVVVSKKVYYYNIIERLKDIPCRRFVFIDACHSGLGKGRDHKSLIEQANAAAPGLVCFMSSGANELSYEYEEGENGVFTEALLEAMRNTTVSLSETGHTVKADQNNDEPVSISIGELRNFLALRVPDLLSKSAHRGKTQTPVCFNKPNPATGKPELSDSQPVFTVTRRQ